MEHKSDEQTKLDAVSFKQKWNSFVTEHGPKSGAFLQSWEWGAFQENIGRKIFRFTIKNNKLHNIIARPQAVANLSTNNEIAALPLVARNDAMAGLVQIIKMPLPFGNSYLYVPRGPVCQIKDLGLKIKDFFDELKNLAKQEGAIFVKVELPVEKQDFNEQRISNIEYRISQNIQPKDTLILNLEKSEEELLAEMREKTRYNIRLAERKGVEVRWATEETLEKDLESFWKLAQETAKRDRFSYHPKSYYEKMIKNFKFQISDFRFPEKTKLNIGLAIAEKDGEALSANIVVFFGNTVTYLHGASNYAHRELMAPHILQWRTIQEAKRLGFRYYDFWGIAPQQNVIARSETIRTVAISLNDSKIAALASLARNDKNHHWGGITRFKMGFGGEVVSYAPGLELITNDFWYKLYHLAKNLF